MDSVKSLKGKGQINPMGIVTLAVTIFIGVVVIGYVYLALNTSTLPTSAQTTINSTLSTALSGMSLLTVAIIVAAAVFILLLMGGGGQ